MTYYLRVWDMSIQNFTLNVTLAELPYNDMLTNALPLQRPSFKAYNDYATVESGEPIKQQSIGQSVWWSYNPSLPGTLVVNSPQKTAYLWQGTNLTQLAEMGNNTNGSPIIQPLAPGTDYRISFDTKPGVLAGDFDALASYYVLPPNDDFVNATPIVNRQNVSFVNGTMYAYTIHGYNYGATVQLNEPPMHQNSVWYTWAAPTNMLVYVSPASGRFTPMSGTMLPS